MQMGWFINEIIYGTFKAEGIRVSVGYNLLHQFRNKIPFGIACFTKSNTEPTNIKSFSSGDAELFILTKDEVNLYSEFLSA